MNTIKALHLILLFGCMSCNVQGQKSDNTIPMYGEVPKSEEYKKVDEEFISATIVSSGSREKGCEHFIQRGWSYFYHDSLDLSMKRFNQAWLLDPNNPDPYFGFAALTEMQANNTAAARYYKLGLEKDTHHDRAVICYQKIADCKEQLNDHKGAAKAYETLLSIDPKNVFAYKKLGYFNSALENDDVALIDYNKAIELDPQDATTYLNRGFLYQKLKKNKIAIADYTKAISIDPKYTSAYANRGVAKMEQVDNDGAKKDFEVCVTLDPNSGQLRRLLGLSKIVSDPKGACSDLEMAVKLGDPDAKGLIEKLCNHK